MKSSHQDATGTTPTCHFCQLILFSISSGFGTVCRIAYDFLIVFDSLSSCFPVFFCYPSSYHIWLTTLYRRHERFSSSQDFLRFCRFFFLLVKKVNWISHSYNSSTTNIVVKIVRKRRIKVWYGSGTFLRVRLKFRYWHIYPYPEFVAYALRFCCFV